MMKATLHYIIMFARVSVYLPAFVVLALLASCAADYAPSGKGVSLAFSVSTNRPLTRMSDAVTQQEGQAFRGLYPSAWLYPCNSEGTPTGSSVGQVSRHGNEYYYLDDHTVDIPLGTRRFLCYAKAAPADDPFVNGSTLSENLDDRTLPLLPYVSFLPDVIHNSTAAETQATQIAAYLTTLANSITDPVAFRQFVNEGRPVACSSTNVGQLERLAGVSEPGTYPTDYPSDILLPDGAAVVMWDGEKFEPVTQTRTDASVNSLDRFVYPAELWYYANSSIKTSTESQKENYERLTTWADVLNQYETDNGFMNTEVRSVAVKQPLSYAVGCLQIGLVSNSSLTDANTENPTTIELAEGSFPLTAVFVSGQYAQAYDFTPKGTDEKIIYDKTAFEGFSLGAARSDSPSASAPSKYTNTLVLQSKDGAPVRFALEFTNNSDQDFLGKDGLVLKGTKFYMVGAIEWSGSQTGPYSARAFTKGYTTRGTVRIMSLKDAYPYLPDLLDPRLEIGIKLVPNWIQSTTTNVPL